MKQNLRLHVLGPFDARRPDGESVELPNKKARALLAYLAVEHGRPHARERLAGMLWGATGDERARHNLRQSLSAIRRSCGEVIASQGDLLELDQSRCDADVIEVERLAGAETADALRRCLGLFRGDLLEGLELREPVYDEWLGLARARYHKLACLAVDNLVRVLTAENRNEEAIEVLERRLSMDPCCEEAHRQLMELLAASGRRSEALRQYRECAEVLERQFGAEPDAETRALYARLKGSEGG